MTERTKVLAIVCSAVMILALPGCAHTARIPSPQIQTPLIDPLPLTVAVHYTDGLHEWKETRQSYGSPLSFPLGTPSIEWLNLALRANFERLVVFDHAPTGAEIEQQGASALIVIAPDTFTFSSATGASIGTAYHIVLSDSHGERIAEWTVQGKFGLAGHDAVRPGAETWAEVPRTLTSVDSVLGEHTGLAMRDAAAQLTIGLRDEPAVRKWLEEHQSYRALLGANDSQGTTPAVGTSGDLLVVSSDTSLLGCMRHALHSPDSRIRVTTLWDLHNALFPWFENTHITPQDESAARLQVIARDQNGHRRLQESGVRYVVEVSGGTEMSTHGAILPLMQYGAYGILWGDRKSKLTATVGDLSELTVTRMDITREGKYFVPAFVLPLPLIPATQTMACGALGSAVLDRLQTDAQARKD